MKVQNVQILNFEIQIFKPAGCLQMFKWLCLENQKNNQRSYYNLPNSAFWGWLSMESQPQNPEFRINPANFHPCRNEETEENTYLIRDKVFKDFWIS